ncbi:MAG: sulfur carrier protein ThiS [Acidobacteria bacterium]|nr:sulfur carrier protein ThiS [Acidobacteriota bacterium]
MNLVLNGQSHVHEGHGTLPELFAELRANPLTVAVMINGDVVPRSRWNSVRLAEHDEVEVLTISAGG